MTTTTIHPYYLTKARKIMASMGFDPDADPTELAAWAQAQPNGDACAFATSDGRIVGTGHTTDGWNNTARYADRQTGEKYGCGRLEESLACGAIGHALGRRVCSVRASRF